MESSNSLALTARSDFDAAKEFHQFLPTLGSSESQTVGHLARATQLAAAQLLVASQWD
jgi:hypothetical protein